MSNGKVCCQPCADAGSCATDRTCCVQCHFSMEEEQAMPYLPYHLQRQLLHEHRWLIAHGLPKAQVVAHAQREMEWFRRYCPPALVAQIDNDHGFYERGELPLQGQSG